MTSPVFDPGLDGRRVMVTRAESQAEELSDLLRRAGAEPVPVAVMRLAPLLDSGRLHDLRRRISDGAFDDVVFTSANAARLLLAGAGPKASVQPRTFAIGPGTEAAIKSAGWVVEPLPGEFIAESLAELILAEGVTGRRFLLPRAQGARGALPELLEQAGAEVTLVPLYQMEPEPSSGPRLRELLERHGVDCVTFTSGSSVTCFLELAQGRRPSPGCVLACIGPITATALRRAHLQPQVVASTHSLEGLVQAVKATFRQLTENSGRHEFS